MEGREKKVTRRNFVKGIGALAGAALLAGGKEVTSSLAQTKKELVFVNFGGEIVPKWQESMIAPFEKDTGIKVTQQSPTNYAKLKGMVESKNVIWDVVDTDVDFAVRAGKQGILEPVDYSVVDRNSLDPDLRNPEVLKWGVPNYYYSYLFAWRSDMFKGDQPKNWADFWDVKKFPGKRALWRWMYGILEAALMADGVPATKVYPIDEKRALNKIKELKPHVASFYDAAAEAQQLLREGEVNMVHTWHTRAYFLKGETKGKVQYTFNQAVLTSSALVVPKGAPNKENAMLFMGAFLKPERQAKMFELTANGPVNPMALKFIPEGMKVENPSDPKNKAVQLALSAQWYADNYDRVLNDYLAAIS